MVELVLITALIAGAVAVLWLFGSVIAFVGLTQLFITATLIWLVYTLGVDYFIIGGWLMIFIGLATLQLRKEG
tara:strand:+ start:311 stop:529 length:219 start_codon:yes stop_codon:yes gene_type:complete